MKTMLLASAAALALCVGGAAQAAQPGMSAAGARGTARPVHHAPAAGMTTLYDQNFASGSYGFFSQTLSSYPQYDEYVADDFTVPAGHTWKVQEVDATGFYYFATGPASSVNVLFWKNNPKKGLPKGTKALVECDDINPKSGLSTGVFQVKLPSNCKVKLKGGTGGTTYWLTVQANMQSDSTSGYWAWQTNTTVAGNMGSVYDYGGGVTVNDPKCHTQFETLQDCYGSTYDLAFALQGRDNGG